ncbi:MAG: hypothetical protein ACYDCL_10995 [Myxococcales bacterium]
MSPGDAAFVTLAANPVGGLLVAIPFAILKLHYPVWLTVVAGVPLAYLQVVAIDLGWTALNRAPWWRRLLARRRSARVEKLLASRGGFWITFFASPVIGPWLVMAFMRYAQVPQRRVALPIVLALAVTAALLAAACALVPALFHV